MRSSQKIQLGLLIGMIDNLKKENNMQDEAKTACIKHLTEIQNDVKRLANQYKTNIKQPMTVEQIVEKINSGDYSAESMMQHLIIYVSRLNE